MNLSDWIGTIGVAMILLAYLLTVFKILTTDDLLYIILNLAGAFIAGLASFMINYIPFIVLEAVWTLISLFSLIRLIPGSGVGHDPDLAGEELPCPSELIAIYSSFSTFAENPDV